MFVLPYEHPLYTDKNKYLYRNLTYNVHRERDESVILDKVRKKVNPVDDQTKLLHQSFSIEKVI